MKITINKILIISSLLFLTLKAINYYKYHRLSWALAPLQEQDNYAITVDIFIENQFYDKVFLSWEKIVMFESIFHENINNIYSIKNIIYDDSIHIYLIKDANPSSIKIQWPKKTIENHQNIKKSPSVKYKNIIIHDI